MRDGVGWGGNGVCDSFDAFIEERMRKSMIGYLPTLQKTDFFCLRLFSGTFHERLNVDVRRLFFRPELTNFSGGHGHCFNFPMGSRSGSGPPTGAGAGADRKN